MRVGRQKARLASSKSVTGDMFKYAARRTYSVRLGRCEGLTETDGVYLGVIVAVDMFLQDIPVKVGQSDKFLRRRGIKFVILRAVQMVCINFILVLARAHARYF